MAKDRLKNISIKEAAKEHSHLLRDIKQYAETLDNSENPNLDSLDFFVPSIYTVEDNFKTYPCYLLTRKGCDMVAKDAVLQSGEQQFEWVIARAYQYIPGSLKLFLSEDMVRKIVRWLYNKGKDYLDDGKLNNSAK